MEQRAGAERVDQKINAEFWEQRAKLAADPRSVTLDTTPIASVQREIRRAQRWMFKRVEAEGCKLEHVADLACGNGDWTVVLAERAQAVFAMDLSRGFVEAARARIEASRAKATVTYVQSDLATVEFPAGLDLAVAGGVLQYLDDERIVPLLARLREALRPDGLLYVRSTVAKRERYVNMTGSYQAIYRTAAWYDEQLAAAGFSTLYRDNATDYMAREIAGDMGALGALFVWPLRLLRRLYRWRRKHDIQVWIVRAAGTRSSRS